MTHNQGVARVIATAHLRLNVTAGYKEIYATLLAAQLADKRVSIRVAEGTNPCAIAYVTLNRNSW